MKTKIGKDVLNHLGSDIVFGGKVKSKKYDVYSAVSFAQMDEEEFIKNAKRLPRLKMALSSVLYLSNKFAQFDQRVPLNQAVELTEKVIGKTGVGKGGIKYWLTNVFVKKGLVTYDKKTNLLRPTQLAFDMQFKVPKLKHVDFTFMGTSKLKHTVAEIPKTDYEKKKYYAQQGLMLNDEILFKGCYDEKTEVLTNEGWKYFKDLHGNELICTLNNRQLIEYQPIMHIIEQNYNGRMVHFKMRSVDLLVTPDHRIYVSRPYKPRDEKTHKQQLVWLPYQRIPAHEIINKHFRFLLTAKWEGKNEEYIRIGERNYPTKKFLKFLGYYLTDGHYTKGRGKYVCVTQKKELWKTIDVCMIELFGGNVRLWGKGKSKTIAVVDNEDLWNFVRQFGKKHQRFIPREILQYSSELLRDLFDGLIGGDGHRTKAHDSDYINFWTCSEQMRDDFQELCLKLGYSACYRATTKPGDIVLMKNRKIIAKKTTYTLGVRLKNNSPVHNLSNYNSQRQTSLVQYKGKVYCVEVPNHVIYVRRSGKPIWCGNSAIQIAGEAYSYLELLPKSKQSEFKKKLDTLISKTKFTDEDLVEMNLIHSDILLALGKQPKLESYKVPASLYKDVLDKSLKMAESANHLKAVPSSTFEELSDMVDNFKKQTKKEGFYIVPSATMKKFNIDFLGVEVKEGKGGIVNQIHQSIVTAEKRLLEESGKFSKVSKRVAVETPLLDTKKVKAFIKEWKRIKAESIFDDSTGSSNAGAFFTIKQKMVNGQIQIGAQGGHGVVLWDDGKVVQLSYFEKGSSGRANLMNDVLNRIGFVSSISGYTVKAYAKSRPVIYERLARVLPNMVDLDMSSSYKKNSTLREATIEAIIKGYPVSPDHIRNALPSNFSKKKALKFFKIVAETIGTGDYPQKAQQFIYGKKKYQMMIKKGVVKPTPKMLGFKVGDVVEITGGSYGKPGELGIVTKLDAQFVWTKSLVSGDTYDKYPQNVKKVTGVKALKTKEIMKKVTESNLEKLSNLSVGKMYKVAPFKLKTGEQTPFESYQFLQDKVGKLVGLTKEDDVIFADIEVGEKPYKIPALYLVSTTEKPTKKPIAKEPKLVSIFEGTKHFVFGPTHKLKWTELTETGMWAESHDPSYYSKGDKVVVAKGHKLGKHFEVVDVAGSLVLGKDEKGVLYIIHQKVLEKVGEKVASKIYKKGELTVSKFKVGDIIKFHDKILKPEVKKKKAEVVKIGNKYIDIKFLEGPEKGNIVSGVSPYAHEISFVKFTEKPFVIGKDKVGVGNIVFMKDHPSTVWNNIPLKVVEATKGSIQVEHPTLPKGDKYKLIKLYRGTVKKLNVKKLKCPECGSEKMMIIEGHEAVCSVCGLVVLPKLGKKLPAHKFSVGEFVEYTGPLTSFEGVYHIQKLTHDKQTGTPVYITRKGDKQYSFFEHELASTGVKTSAEKKGEKLSVGDVKALMQTYTADPAFLDKDGTISLSILFHQFKDENVSMNTLHKAIDELLDEKKLWQSEEKGVIKFFNPDLTAAYPKSTSFHKTKLQMIQQVYPEKKKSVFVETWWSELFPITKGKPIKIPFWMGKTKYSTLLSKGAKYYGKGIGTAILTQEAVDFLNEYSKSHGHQIKFEFK